MDIQSFCVNKNTPLLEVMQEIDRNMNGIVFVVDESVLIGVISDGDIRRFILKYQTLEVEAERIMNSKPLYLYEKDIRIATKVMKTNKIRAIPILNSQNEIIQIEFIDKVTSIKKVQIDIPVVIMAGGKGTRLYPYTDILPKPLIPINDKTITEIIMEHFEEYGCSKFKIIVNYKKGLIKAFFNETNKIDKIEFIDEDEFLGTAGGLKLLGNKIKETFFMSNCDVLIEEDYSQIYNYHKKSNNVLTLVCALKKEEIPYGTVRTDNYGNLLELTEKPCFDFLINTGLYVIEPSFLDEIPEKKFIHITDVIQICLSKKMKIGIYPIREDAWMDMGQLEELEKMRAKLNE